MPSRSAAQARLMAAAAHTPGGYGGVPQSVGKEFNEADTGTGILNKKSAPSGREKDRKANKRLKATGFKGKKTRRYTGA